MEEELMEALKSANSLCRSANEIAKREGQDTNWESFQKKLDESLAIQHRVLYPAEAYVEDEDSI